MDDIDDAMETRRQLFDLATELTRHESFRGLDSDERTAIARTALRALVALSARGADQCSLVHPPTDIEVSPDGDDDALILRCSHYPPHCWSYTGTSIDCP